MIPAPVISQVASQLIGHAAPGLAVVAAVGFAGIPLGCTLKAIDDWYAAGVEQREKNRRTQQRTDRLLRRRPF